MRWVIRGITFGNFVFKIQQNIVGRNTAFPWYIYIVASCRDICSNFLSNLRFPPPPVASSSTPSLHFMHCRNHGSILILLGMLQLWVNLIDPLVLATHKYNAGRNYFQFGHTAGSGRLDRISCKILGFQFLQLCEANSGQQISRKKTHIVSSQDYHKNLVIQSIPNMDLTTEEGAGPGIYHAANDC